MQLRLTFLPLLVALACGTPDDGTATADTTAPSSTSAATADTTADTGAGTTAASTTDAPTSSGGQTATGDAATGDHGHTTLTTVPETTTNASVTTGDDTSTGDGSTGDTSTGGVDFERFRLGRAAGPCPPMADCDGFIELLADGLLRVEPFGEVGNPVTEVQIDQADLDAAVPVFTAPALLALLDGPDPACDPPTDIFEDMLSAVAGDEHQATTTFCMQPPIAAARDMADTLQMKYAP
ncbi:MAG: hypothetical protein JNL82_06375 [Myxococcales bacterium]|nr:hypothetical protein [Myxococcales bacterium]